MLRRSTFFMYTGVVTSWKAGSPYGFVKDTDTGASYFLHKDDIVEGSRNRINSLPEGFRVEFDKAMYEGRTKAVAITLRGGAPITSTGESSSASSSSSSRRGRDDERDFDRDYDRDDRRRDDRDDRRRDDRDDRRRDDRDDRRRDDRDDTMARERREFDRERREYDRELSRIQGSLAVLARVSNGKLRTQQKIYHGLLSIADKKGIVVPAMNDEAHRNANHERWADYNENTEELREAARERQKERRAARDSSNKQSGDDEVSSSSNSKPSSEKKQQAAPIDAEDMF